MGARHFILFGQIVQKVLQTRGKEVISKLKSTKARPPVFLMKSFYCHQFLSECSFSRKIYLSSCAIISPWMQQRCTSSIHFNEGLLSHSLSQINPTFLVSETSCTDGGIAKTFFTFESGNIFTKHPVLRLERRLH